MSSILPALLLVAICNVITFLGLYVSMNHTIPPKDEKQQYFHDMTQRGFLLMLLNNLLAVLAIIWKF